MFMTSDRDSYPLTSILSVSEVLEQLEVMHQQEESATYKCRDYIDDYDTFNYPSTIGKSLQDERGIPVDRDCRVKMCEWCYQVTDFLQFKRETVAISMSYLDRFLSTPHPRARGSLHDRKEYQLAAMTSLYIAIKLFEPMVIDTQLLSTISRGCYTELDIVNMEQEILTALSWRVNGPTAHDFLSHMISLLFSSAQKYDDTAAMRTILDISKFHVEIAVCDYDIALQKPSAVALASIFNSIEDIDENFFSSRSMYDFVECIANASKLDTFSEEVNAVRARLLELNSGCELQKAANNIQSFNTRSTTSKLSASPVSVKYFPRRA